ncbi:MAG: YceD family protein [Candidatus Rokuibacteriota bacterium]
MIIRVSEIPDEGIQVASPVDVGDVFPEEGWSLDAVDLGIAKRGAEVAVTGSFQASARLQCSRCLEPLVTRVTPAADLHLLPSPATRHEQMELGPDDLEVDFYQGDILDLARLLWSETQLALPMKPLCRPECRGLCPVCGGNRNVTACACGGREVDPRLAPLEALRRRSRGDT